MRRPVADAGDVCAHELATFDLDDTLLFEVLCGNVFHHLTLNSVLGFVGDDALVG